MVAEWEQKEKAELMGVGMMRNGQNGGLWPRESKCCICGKKEVSGKLEMEGTCYFFGNNWPGRIAYEFCRECSHDLFKKIEELKAQKHTERMKRELKEKFKEGKK